ncbi:RFIP5 protein, partial [Rhinopomastus cyanomelas]|nr:RFIP5 protein [Rhinopomastus cyanomelas]
WLPSHVQVTVVRARGLRCKGKAGTSDAYAVIQLGRERYRTAVAEKSTGSAEWGEQCAFELPPEPPAGAQPGLLLLLTVLHRALVGTDRFLGQAALPLEPALRQGRGPDERWYKLHSKAGKKEKERGEILVSIQFTRNNLTASMFDLSMKDKPRSPFGKLKDKMKGKKKYDLESASAIIPSSMGALDMEDDYDLGKKSKVKGFFLKNKLRKSSLTQSNTSLGSDSTISSASLSLAANVPEVTKSPSRHSSLSMERSVKDLLPSPKLTHKRAFSDDVSQVSPVLEPKAIQHLKPKNDPVSRSSLCINGSHVYGDEPVPKSSVTVPQSSAPVSVPSVPRRQEENFGFTPLHPDIHEVPWGLGSLERTQQRDEPRFIPSPPSLALQEELKVSTKAVTLSNHLGRAKMEENSRLENKPTQAAAPMVFSTDMTKDKQPDETRKEDKKAKSGLFHHGGKGQGEKGGPLSVHAAAGGEERSKTSSWFSLKEPKESPQRPSLEVSPQVETSSDAPSHSPPCSPAQFAPAVALLTSMPRANLPPALRDGQSGCLSPTNPFLNSLQSNPFFEDLLADQVLNSPSPTHFFSSFPSEPHPSTEKPAVPPPLSEWDDTFDAFATSRLKPEPKEDSFFVSVASEGMAFIDDPDAASPTERSSEEEGDSNEEEPSSPGTNGWMTIATETTPDPSESTQSGTEPEHGGLESAFGDFEAKSRSHSTTGVLTRSTFTPELSSETLPGSNVVAVSPRLLTDTASQRFSSAPEQGTEPQGSEEEAFDIWTSVYRLQASMRLEASEGRARLGSDVRERHVVLAPWPGTQEREDMAASSAVPPPKPPRWFTAAGSGGAGHEGDVCDPQPRHQRGSEERGEDAESPEVDVELPRSHQSSEPSVPASPSLTLIMNVGAQESRSQPVLSPRKGAAGCDQEDVASEQMSCPEELSVVGLNPPSKLDLVQPETFWTALEEQEAADHPTVAIPPQEAEQGRPGSEHRGSWRRCSAGSRIDFKKADFWKPERAEESRERDASAPRNPFAPALSPNAPSNPFVDKSPDPLPVQAALPEQLGQGSFSFSSPHKEALGQGFQPTNLPGDLLGKPPSLHANQPLAFSTPFLVAATNPNQFDFPSPMACPASSGIPAASSRAVAQPCPLPQSGDTQASALVVLPRETQPAEKSFFQQMTSPHPVKPISAATQEVSSEKKQQHRSSLSSALSNGLEKLKMATTSSVQPVAPSSHLEKTDSKVLKDPNVLDQSAKYYHLTHDELIQLLLQREKELSKKEEHIHELENYIDQLLVRIMEQSPTLLQIPLEESKAK